MAADLSQLDGVLASMDLIVNSLEIEEENRKSAKQDQNRKTEVKSDLSDVIQQLHQLQTDDSRTSTLKTTTSSSSSSSGGGRVWSKPPSARRDGVIKKEPSSKSKTPKLPVEWSHLPSVGNVIQVAARDDYTSPPPGGDRKKTIGEIGKQVAMTSYLSPMSDRRQNVDELKQLPLGGDRRLSSGDSRKPFKLPDDIQGPVQMARRMSRDSNPEPDYADIDDDTELIPDYEEIDDENDTAAQDDDVFPENSTIQKGGIQSKAYNPFARSVSLPGSPIFYHERRDDSKSADNSPASERRNVSLPSGGKVYAKKTGASVRRKSATDELKSENEIRKEFLRRTSLRLSETTKTRTIVVHVYNTDGTHRTLSVDHSVKARDLCYLLVIKNHVIDDKNWTIVEYIKQLNVERVLEDHEMIVPVIDSWADDADNRLIFRNDFRKYDFFQRPEIYFPVKKKPPERKGSSKDKPQEEDKTARAKAFLLQSMFKTTDRLPDTESYLHFREKGKKSWKRAFCLLRAFGIYYSTRGTSKEIKHLCPFVSIEDKEIYIVLDALTAKFYSGAATNFVIALKSLSENDVTCLCFDTEHAMRKWRLGLRFAKYGNQLRDNYQVTLRRHDKLRKLSDKSGSSDQTYRYSASQPIDEPWYHGPLSRDDSERLLADHVTDDGVFVLRDSSDGDGFAISFTCQRLVCHYKIDKVRVAGQVYYTCNGDTKFPSLKAMVKHHLLNIGPTIPCKLSKCVEMTTNELFQPDLSKLPVLY
ncbi:uncharacterized protein LOC141911754 [Tubulanus polymorphus]|uniref:uncharacterized protein LOC141911754 n=1 Tax=Tubulanus polymorphus TaxID=672921 RepID=UPI003DA5B487